MVFNCLAERIEGGPVDTWRRQFRVNYTPEKEQGAGGGDEKAEHNDSSSIEYQKQKHMV